MHNLCSGLSIMVSCVILLTVCFRSTNILRIRFSTLANYVISRTCALGDANISNRPLYNGQLCNTAHLYIMSTNILRTGFSAMVNYVILRTYALGNAKATHVSLQWSVM